MSKTKQPKRKSVPVATETHDRLKRHCNAQGYKMSAAATVMLNESLDRRAA